MHLEQYGNCRLGDKTIVLPSQKNSFVMWAMWRFESKTDQQAKAEGASEAKVPSLLAFNR
jgi:hypothetical protein